MVRDTELKPNDIDEDEDEMKMKWK